MCIRDRKYAAKRIETDGASDAWWPQLHSFAIGLNGAPDLIKAREVDEYIGTVHHEINYTVQEGLDAIRDVIYFIETYDAVSYTHLDVYKRQPFGLGKVEHTFHFTIKPVPHLFQHDIGLSLIHI